MHEDFNPYAAPASTAMHPRAAEWLRSTDDPSLQKVARGLGNIYTGIIAIAIGMVLILIVLVPVMITAAAAGRPIVARDIEGVLVIPMIVGGISVLVGYILTLIGYLRCLATPSETGARGLIITSVMLAVLGFVANAVFREDETLDSIGGFLSLASQITFLLFLKRLSEFIGAGPLADRAKTLLILLGVMFGLGVLLALSLVAGFAIGLLAGLGLIGVALCHFFLYLGLLNRLRLAIMGDSA